jgi:iron complex outermembrane receptor protein
MSMPSAQENGRESRCQRKWQFHALSGWVCGLTLGISNGANAQATSQPESATSEPALQEVVVTARKQSESISDVPVSITAIGADSLKAFNIQSFDDYANKIPNLNFAYGQGGLGVTTSETIAIRGISGTNTTGFYIDDTPVPNTMNPRVLDIERIEALKGPQGTLYGAASMGGNVRLISNQPDVDNNSGNYMVQGGATSGGSSPDYGGSAVGNMVIIPGALAVRVVAFDQHDAGFLTNTFPGPNGSGTESLNGQGGDRIYGGSITLRLKVSDNFDATFRVLDQQQYNTGLPEAYAPLPEFVPSSYILNRTADVPEGAWQKSFLSALDLEYRGDSFKLTSSTSYFYDGQDEWENGTEGTGETIERFYGVNLNPSVGLPYSLVNFMNSFTEEARASTTFSDSLSSIAGVYYNRKWYNGGIPTVIVPGLESNGLYSSNMLYDGNTWSRSDEFAIFGEVYYKFLDKFTLTLGGRNFHLKQSFNQYANGFFNGGPSTEPNLSSNQTGFSPKAALAYEFAQHANVYASYAQGFRPGGAQVPPPPFCSQGEGTVAGVNLEQYKSDTVDTFEVGVKSDVLNNHGYFSVAVFQTLWKDMQQSVVLPCSYGITENTGEARIRGGEFEFNGEVLHGLQVRAGLGLLDAKIVDQGSGLLTVGERIFQVPRVNGTLGIVYTSPRQFWNLGPYISADYSYMGNRISQNNTNPEPLTEPSYSLVNFNTGVTFGNSDLSLYVKNLTNARPNLGDIQQTAYPQVIKEPNGQLEDYLEVGLLPPLTVGLQFKQHF